MAMTKDVKEFLDRYREELNRRPLKELLSEREDLVRADRKGELAFDAEQLRVLDEVVSQKKRVFSGKGKLKSKLVANQVGLEKIFIDNRVLISTVLSGDQRGISILIQTGDQLFLFNAGGAVEAALGGVAFSNDTLSYASETIINEQIVGLNYQRGLLRERFNKKTGNMDELIKSVAEIDKKVVELEQQRTKVKLGLESITDVFLSNINDSTISALHKMQRANSKIHVYGDVDSIVKAVKGKTDRKTNAAKYTDSVIKTGGDLKSISDGITIRSFVDDTRGLKIHAVEVSKGVFGGVVEDIGTGGKVAYVPLADKSKKDAVNHILTGFGELNAIYVQAPTTSVEVLGNTNTRFMTYYDGKLLADDVSDMIYEAYKYNPNAAGARALHKVAFVGAENSLGITHQATLLSNRLNIGAERERVRVSVASPARGDRNDVFVYRNTMNAAVLTEGTESLSNINQMIRSAAIAGEKARIEADTVVLDEPAENALLTAKEEIKSVWQVYPGDDFVTRIPSEIDDVVPGEAVGSTHFDMWTESKIRKVGTESDAIVQTWVKDAGKDTGRVVERKVKGIHSIIGEKFQFNSNPLKIKRPTEVTRLDVSYMDGARGIKWTDILDEGTLGRKVSHYEDLLDILTNKNNPKEAQLAFDLLVDNDYIDVPYGADGKAMSNVAARHELIRLRNDVVALRGDVELKAMQDLNRAADAYKFKGMDSVYKINMSRMASELSNDDESILAMIGDESKYSRKDVYAAVTTRVKKAKESLGHYEGKVDADRKILSAVQQELGPYSNVNIIGDADLNEEIFKIALRGKGVSELEVQKKWRRVSSARASIGSELRIKKWVTDTNDGITYAVKAYKDKKAVVRRPATGVPPVTMMDWKLFTGTMRENLLTPEKVLIHAAEGVAAAYKHTVDNLGIVVEVKQSFWDIQENARRVAESQALRVKIEEMIAAGDVTSPDFVRFVREYDTAVRALEGTNFLLLDVPPVNLDYGTERAIDVIAMRTYAKQIETRGKSVFGADVPREFQDAMHMIDMEEVRISGMRASETKSATVLKEVIDSHIQLKLRVFAERMEVAKASPEEYGRAFEEGVGFLQGKLGLRPKYTQEDLVASLPRINQLGTFVELTDPALKPHINQIVSKIIFEFDKEKARIPIVSVDRKFMVRNDVREAYSKELIDMADRRSALLSDLDNMMESVELKRRQIWGMQRDPPSPGAGFGSHLSGANAMEYKEAQRWETEIGRVTSEIDTAVNRVGDLRKEILGIEYQWAKLLSHNPVRYSSSVENLSNLDRLLHVPGYLTSDMDVMYTNMNVAALEKARILSSYHTVRKTVENARLKGYIDDGGYKIVVDELEKSISLNDQKLFRERFLPQVEEMLAVNEPGIKRQHMLAHANTIYNAFIYRMTDLNGRLDGAKGAIDRVIAAVTSDSEFPVNMIERERFSHDIERVSTRGVLLTVESNDPVQAISKYALPQSWNLGAGENGPAVHMDLIRKYGFGYTKNDVRSAFMFPIRDEFGELVYKVNVSYNATVEQTEKLLLEAQRVAKRTPNINKLAVEIPTTVFSGVMVDKEKYPLLATYLTRVKVDVQTTLGGGLITPQGIEGSGGQYGILKLDGKDVLRKFPTVMASWNIPEYEKAIGGKFDVVVYDIDKDKVPGSGVAQMPATLQHDVYEFMGTAVEKSTRGKTIQYSAYLAEMQAGVSNVDVEATEKALARMGNAQAAAVDEVIRRGDDIFYNSNISKTLRGGRNVAVPRIPMLIYIDKADNIRTSLLPTDAHTRAAIDLGEWILPIDAKFSVIMDQAADGAYVIKSPKIKEFPAHLSWEAIYHEALTVINSMTVGFQEMSFSNAQIGERKAIEEMEKRLTKDITHRWYTKDPKSGLSVANKAIVAPELLEALQADENMLSTNYVKELKEAGKLLGDDRLKAETAAISNFEEGTMKLYAGYEERFPETKAIARIKNEYLGVAGKDIYNTGVVQAENGVITKYNMMMGAGGVTLRFEGTPPPEFTTELLDAEIRRLSEQQALPQNRRFARQIQELISTLRANRLAAASVGREMTIMPGSMPALNKVMYAGLLERVSRKLDLLSKGEPLSEAEDLVIKQMQHLAAKARAGVITGEQVVGLQMFINGSLRELAFINAHAPQLSKEREALMGLAHLTQEQALRLQELDNTFALLESGMALREGAAMQMVRLSKTTVENIDAIKSNAVELGRSLAVERLRHKPELRALADMLPPTQDFVDTVLGIDREYVGMFEGLEYMREVAERKRLKRDGIIMQRRQRLTGYVNADIKKYQAIVEARNHVFGAFEQEFWRGPVRVSGRTNIINANNALIHLGSSRMYKEEQLAEVKEVLTEAFDVVVQAGDTSEASKYKSALDVVDAWNAENLAEQSARYHVHETRAEVEFAKNEIEHLRTAMLMGEDAESAIKLGSLEQQLSSELLLENVHINTLSSKIDTLPHIVKATYGRYAALGLRPTAKLKWINSELESHQRILADPLKTVADKTAAEEAIARLLVEKTGIERFLKDNDADIQILRKQIEKQAEEYGYADKLPVPYLKGQVQSYKDRAEVVKSQISAARIASRPVTKEQVDLAAKLSSTAKYLEDSMRSRPMLYTQLESMYLQEQALRAEKLLYTAIAPELRQVGVWAPKYAKLVGELTDLQTGIKQVENVLAVNDKLWFFKRLFMDVKDVRKMLGRAIDMAKGDQSVYVHEIRQQRIDLGLMRAVHKLVENRTATIMGFLDMHFAQKDGVGFGQHLGDEDKYIFKDIKRRKDIEEIARRITDKGQRPGTANVDIINELANFGNFYVDLFDEQMTAELFQEMDQKKLGGGRLTQDIAGEGGLPKIERLLSAPYKRDESERTAELTKVYRGAMRRALLRHLYSEGVHDISTVEADTLVDRSLDMMMGYQELFNERVMSRVKLARLLDRELDMETAMRQYKAAQAQEYDLAKQIYVIGGRIVIPGMGEAGAKGKIIKLEKEAEKFKDVVVQKAKNAGYGFNLKDDEILDLVILNWNRVSDWSDPEPMIYEKILAAKQAYKDKVWVKWADDWLADVDRSEAAALDMLEKLPKMRASEQVVEATRAAIDPAYTVLEWRRAYNVKLAEIQEQAAVYHAAEAEFEQVQRRRIGLEKLITGRVSADKAVKDTFYADRGLVDFGRFVDDLRSQGRVLSAASVDDEFALFSKSLSGSNQVLNRVRMAANNLPLSASSFERRIYDGVLSQIFTETGLHHSITIEERINMAERLSVIMRNKFGVLVEEMYKIPGVEKAGGIYNKTVQVVVRNDVFMQQLAKALRTLNIKADGVAADVSRILTRFMEQRFSGIETVDPFIKDLQAGVKTVTKQLMRGEIHVPYIDIEFALSDTDRARARELVVRNVRGQISTQEKKELSKLLTQWGDAKPGVIPGITPGTVEPEAIYRLMLLKDGRTALVRDLYAFSGNELLKGEKVKAPLHTDWIEQHLTDRIARQQSIEGNAWPVSTEAKFERKVIRVFGNARTEDVYKQIIRAEREAQVLATLPEAQVDDVMAMLLEVMLTRGTAKVRAARGEIQALGFNEIIKKYAEELKYMGLAPRDLRDALDSTPNMKRAMEILGVAKVEKLDVLFDTAEFGLYKAQLETFIAIRKKMDTASRDLLAYNMEIREMIRTNDAVPIGVNFKELGKFILRQLIDPKKESWGAEYERLSAVADARIALSDRIGSLEREIVAIKRASEDAMRGVQYALDGRVGKYVEVSKMNKIDISGNIRTVTKELVDANIVLNTGVHPDMARIPDVRDQILYKMAWVDKFDKEIEASKKRLAVSIMDRSKVIREIGAEEITQEMRFMFEMEVTADTLSTMMLDRYVDMQRGALEIEQDEETIKTIKKSLGAVEAKGGIYEQVAEREKLGIDLVKLRNIDDSKNVKEMRLLKGMMEDIVEPGMVTVFADKQYRLPIDKVEEEILTLEETLRITKEELKKTNARAVLMRPVMKLRQPDDTLAATHEALSAVSGTLKDKLRAEEERIRALARPFKIRLSAKDAPVNDESLAQFFKANVEYRDTLSELSVLINKIDSAQAPAGTYAVKMQELVKRLDSISEVHNSATKINSGFVNMSEIHSVDMYIEEVLDTWWKNNNGLLPKELRDKINREIVPMSANIAEEYEAGLERAIIARDALINRIRSSDDMLGARLEDILVRKEVVAAQKAVSEAEANVARSQLRAWYRANAVFSTIDDWIMGATTVGKEASPQVRNVVSALRDVVDRKSFAIKDMRNKIVSSFAELAKEGLEQAGVDKFMRMFDDPGAYSDQVIIDAFVELDKWIGTRVKLLPDTNIIKESMLQSRLSSRTYIEILQNAVGVLSDQSVPEANELVKIASKNFAERPWQKHTALAYMQPLLQYADFPEQNNILVRDFARNYDEVYKSLYGNIGAYNKLRTTMLNGGLREYSNAELQVLVDRVGKLEEIQWAHDITAAEIKTYGAVFTYLDTHRWNGVSIKRRNFLFEQGKKQGFITDNDIKTWKKVQKVIGKPIGLDTIEGKELSDLNEILKRQRKLATLRLAVVRDFADIKAMRVSGAVSEYAVDLGNRDQLRNMLTLNEELRAGIKKYTLLIQDPEIDAKGFVAKDAMETIHTYTSQSGAKFLRKGKLLDALARSFGPRELIATQDVETGRISLSGQRVIDVAYDFMTTTPERVEVMDRVLGDISGQLAKTKNKVIAPGGIEFNIKAPEMTFAKVFADWERGGVPRTTFMQRLEELRKPAADGTNIVNLRDLVSTVVHGVDPAMDPADIAMYHRDMAQVMAKGLKPEQREAFTEIVSVYSAYFTDAIRVAGAIEHYNALDTLWNQIADPKTIERVKALGTWERGFEEFSRPLGRMGVVTMNGFRRQKELFDGVQKFLAGTIGIGEVIGRDIRMDVDGALSKFIRQAVRIGRDSKDLGNAAAVLKAAYRRAIHGASYSVKSTVGQTAARMFGGQALATFTGLTNIINHLSYYAYAMGGHTTDKNMRMFTDSVADILPWDPDGKGASQFTKYMAQANRSWIESKYGARGNKAVVELLKSLDKSADDMSRMIAQGVTPQTAAAKGYRQVDAAFRNLKQGEESLIGDAGYDGANTALSHSFADNVQFIAKLEYVAINDSRTCKYCRSSDGVLYNVGDPKPSLPRHSNCRCTYRAWFRSPDEIVPGTDITEKTKPVRLQRWLNINDGDLGGIGESLNKLKPPKPSGIVSDDDWLGWFDEQKYSIREGLVGKDHTLAHALGVFDGEDKFDKSRALSATAMEILSSAYSDTVRHSGMELAKNFASHHEVAPKLGMAIADMILRRDPKAAIMGLRNIPFKRILLEPDGIVSRSMVGGFNKMLGDTSGPGGALFSLATKHVPEGAMKAAIEIGTSMWNDITGLLPARIASRLTSGEKENLAGAISKVIDKKAPYGNVTRSYAELLGAADLSGKARHEGVLPNWFKSMEEFGNAALNLGAEIYRRPGAEWEALQTQMDEAIMMYPADEVTAAMSRRIMTGKVLGSYEAGMPGQISAEQLDSFKDVLKPLYNKKTEGGTLDSKILSEAKGWFTSDKIWESEELQSRVMALTTEQRSQLMALVSPKNQGRFNMLMQGGKIETNLSRFRVNTVSPQGHIYGENGIPRYGAKEIWAGPDGCMYVGEIGDIVEAMRKVDPGVSENSFVKLIFRYIPGPDGTQTLSIMRDSSHQIRGAQNMMEVYDAKTLQQALERVFGELKLKVHDEIIPGTNKKTGLKTLKTNTVASALLGGQGNFVDVLAGAGRTPSYAIADGKFKELVIMAVEGIQKDIASSGEIVDIKRTHEVWNMVRRKYVEQIDNVTGREALIRMLGDKSPTSDSLIRIREIIAWLSGR